MGYSDIKFSKPQRKRRGLVLGCETCGKEFYVSPARLRQVKKNGNTVRFCSMKCYDKTGEKNPFWGKRHSRKSLKKMINNPNRVRFPKGVDNPNFVRFGDTFEGINRYWWKRNRHRLSDKCQRCGFTDTEILILHHKDRNVKNNTRDNLEVLCPNCHAREHFDAKDGMYSRLR